MFSTAERDHLIGLLEIADAARSALYDYLKASRGALDTSDGEYWRLDAEEAKAQQGVEDYKAQLRERYFGR